jgi:hypothetical protein
MGRPWAESPRQRSCGILSLRLIVLQGCTLVEAGRISRAAETHDGGSEHLFSRRSCCIHRTRAGSALRCAEHSGACSRAVGQSPCCSSATRRQTAALQCASAGGLDTIVSHSTGKAALELTTQIEPPGKGAATARDGTLELGVVATARSASSLCRGGRYVLLLDLENWWETGHIAPLAAVCGCTRWRASGDVLGRGRRGSRGVGGRLHREDTRARVGGAELVLGLGVVGGEGGVECRVVDGRGRCWQLLGRQGVGGIGM